MNKRVALIPIFSNGQLSCTAVSSRPVFLILITTHLWWYHFNSSPSIELVIIPLTLRSMSYTRVIRQYWRDRVASRVQGRCNTPRLYSNCSTSLSSTHRHSPSCSSGFRAEYTRIRSMYSILSFLFSAWERDQCYQVLSPFSYFSEQHGSL